MEILAASSCGMFPGGLRYANSTQPNLPGPRNVESLSRPTRQSLLRRLSNVCLRCEWAFQGRIGNLHADASFWRIRMRGICLGGLGWSAREAGDLVMSHLSHRLEILASECHFRGENSKISRTKGNVVEGSVVGRMLWLQVAVAAGIAGS